MRPLWPELYEIEADDVPEPGRFIRFAAPDATGGGLDVAVTNYVSDEPGKPALQLLGVVHIADEIYYQNVQRVLDGADAVLFEAIMPEGKTMPEWRAAMAPKDEDDVAGLQQELARWFGFQYQLDGIDYSAERYVHADMTAEQFVEEAGDDIDALPIDLSGDSEALTPDVKAAFQKVRAFGRLLLAEPNPIRSLARRIMAEALGTLDHANALGMFPGLDHLILYRRNEVVMEKLKLEMERTEGAISIFYGAAHNPDLEKRILELGYRRQSAFWLRAWALRPPLK